MKILIQLLVLGLVGFVVSKPVAAEDLEFSRCSVSLGLKAGARYSPAPPVSFIALKPWEKNNDVHLSSTFRFKSRTGNSADDLTAEVVLTGKKISVYKKAKSKSLNTYQSYDWPESKTESKKVTLKGEAVLGNLQLDCVDQKGSEFLLGVDKNFDGLDSFSIRKLHCSNGCKVDMVDETIVEDGDVIKVSTDVSSGASDAELKHMAKHGKFYDKDPKSKDSTDAWVERLAPTLKVPQSIVLACTKPLTSETIPELEATEYKLYQQLTTAYAAALEMPEADRKKLGLLPHFDHCGQQGALARTQCVYEKCLTVNSSKELNFPHRYFKNLVRKTRLSRWEEIIKDSIQLEFNIADEKSYALTDKIDLHFVKTAALERPNSIDILAQVYADRLKLKFPEARKEITGILEDKKNPARQDLIRMLLGISSEVSKWTLEQERGNRKGTLQAGRAEFVSILVPRNFLTLDTQDYGMQEEQLEMGAASNTKSKKTASIKAPSKNSKQVIQTSVSTAAKTPGNKLTFFHIKLDGSLDCKKIQSTDFRNYWHTAVFKKLETYLAPVAQYYGKQNNWRPGVYPDVKERNDCYAKFPKAYDTCEWIGTCVQAQTSGAEVGLSLDYYNFLKDEAEKTEYVDRYSVKAVPFDGEKGELDFIAWGALFSDDFRSSIVDKSVTLSEDQIEKLLSRHHGFETIEDFKEFRKNNDRYQLWYSGFTQKLSNPETLKTYALRGLVDGGIYVIVPPGREGIMEEGISSEENPFRTATLAAAGLTALRDHDRDLKLKGLRLKSSPLIMLIHSLGWQDSDYGKLAINFDAEVTRGTVEYAQSWVTKPGQNIYQTLSTDGGQKIKRGVSCVAAAVDPLKFRDCIWPTDTKKQSLEKAAGLERFNTQLERSLQRPEALYCDAPESAKYECMAFWARLAPSFLGDTALMLASAPLGGAGVLGSTLLISSRQASEAYYTTVKRQLNGRNFQDLKISEREKIVTKGLQTGTQAFLVAASTTIAGMKAQGALSTAIIGSKSGVAVAERQLALRAFTGELAGLLIVNPPQTAIQLAADCKLELQKCDAETLLSSFIVSTATSLPMSIGTSASRLFTQGKDGQLTATDALKNLKPDLEAASKRQQIVRKMADQSSLNAAELAKAEGAVRNVLSKTGKVESEILAKTAPDKFGWFSPEDYLLLRGIQADQNLKNLPPPKPKTLIVAASDLKGLSKSKKILTPTEEDVFINALLADTRFSEAMEYINRRSLSVEERSRLAKGLELSHQVAPNKQVFDYTFSELRKKFSILMDHGYTKYEADALIRAGYAGKPPLRQLIEPLENLFAGFNSDVGDGNYLEKRAELLRIVTDKNPGTTGLLKKLLHYLWPPNWFSPMPTDAQTITNNIEALSFIDYQHSIPQLNKALNGKVELKDSNLAHTYEKQYFDNFKEARSYLLTEKPPLNANTLMEVHKRMMKLGRVEGILASPMGVYRTGKVGGNAESYPINSVGLREVQNNPYLTWIQSREANGLYYGKIRYPDPTHIRPAGLDLIRNSHPQLVKDIEAFQNLPGIIKQKTAELNSSDPNYRTREQEIKVLKAEHAELVKREEKLTSDLVKSLIDDVMDWFTRERTLIGDLSTPAKVEAYADLVAEFQRKLVSIHPFNDGNGRSTREFGLAYALMKEGLPPPRIMDTMSDITISLDDWKRQVKHGMIDSNNLVDDLVERLKFGLPLENSIDLFTPYYRSPVKVGVKGERGKKFMDGVEHIDPKVYKEVIQRELKKNPNLLQEMKNNPEQAWDKIHKRVEEIFTQNNTYYNHPKRGMLRVELGFVDDDFKALYGKLSHGNPELFNYKMNTWYSKDLNWRGLASKSEVKGEGDILKLFTEFTDHMASNAIAEKIWTGGPDSIRKAALKDFDNYNNDLFGGGIVQMARDHSETGPMYGISYGYSTSKVREVGKAFAMGAMVIADYGAHKTPELQALLKTRLLVGARKSVKDVDLGTLKQVREDFSYKYGRQQEVMGIGASDPDAITIVQTIDAEGGVEVTYLRNPDKPGEIWVIRGDIDPKTKPTPEQIIKIVKL
ncbi:MAG TPA: Fic family protein [Bacteriovoracaceae bacterium]|nr:Fic family protein [Bacteriovoracaceae bacterium]